MYIYITKIILNYLKCHPRIYAEPYSLILRRNCKNKSCSARRFKYKSVFYLLKRSQTGAK